MPSTSLPMDTTAAHAEMERHRPLRRPYPGAPDIRLDHCPACDGATSGRGVREQARMVWDPYSCGTWRECVAAGCVTPDAAPAPPTR